jgi:rsbT co-antagonist protein RsbR
VEEKAVTGVNRLLEAPEVNEPLLRELVAHLRGHRDGLRDMWLERISRARLLEAMSSQEIFTEATAVYDN